MEATNNPSAREFARTITFKDGTVLHGDGAINSTTDELWLWVSDQEYNISEIALLCANPEKTAEIRIDYSMISHIDAVGYTVLTSVQRDIGMKQILTRLNKPKT